MITSPVTVDTIIMLARMLAVLPPDPNGLIRYESEAQASGSEFAAQPKSAESAGMGLI
jgi:hypothetical protein